MSIVLGDCVSTRHRSIYFTKRGCHSCKASDHEAVVCYCNWAATQQMRQDRFARRVKIDELTGLTVIIM